MGPYPLIITPLSPNYPHKNDLHGIYHWKPIFFSITFPLILLLNCKNGEPLYTKMWERCQLRFSFSQKHPWTPLINVFARCYSPNNTFNVIIFTLLHDPFTHFSLTLPYDTQLIVCSCHWPLSTLINLVLLVENCFLE